RRKIVIPANLKWQVRDHLDQCNINDRMLFPGLDGLCSWLKRFYRPGGDRKPAARKKRRSEVTPRPPSMGSAIHMSDSSVRLEVESLLEHTSWVRALARRLASDDSAADDVEQATWLAALRSPRRDGVPERGWLGAIVRNF